MIAERSEALLRAQRFRGVGNHMGPGPQLCEVDPSAPHSLRRVGNSRADSAALLKSPFTIAEPQSVGRRLKWRLPLRYFVARRGAYGGGPPG